MSDTLTRRHEVIEPRWWDGTPATDPATYRIDCSQLAMDADDLRPDG